MHRRALRQRRMRLDKQWRWRHRRQPLHGQQRHHLHRDKENAPTHANQCTLSTRDFKSKRRHTCGLANVCAGRVVFHQFTMAQIDPIEQFAEKVAASLADGTFVRLVLSSPAKPDGAPEKILGRCVELKGGVVLSLTFRYPTRDVTKNLFSHETPGWIREQLGEAFGSALLGTTKRDWQFSRDKSGAARIVVHKPASTEAPARTHNKPHQTILDDTARDWLHGLGVVNNAGHVRPAMADKYSQINRYLEIFSHLAKDCGWIDGPEAKPANRELTLADMGCGKGYLTFGVWHLFHRLWRIPAKIIGVEARADLVATTNILATRIGANGLEFRAGTIDSAQLPPVNALIALHACDTATDDAIRRGIELGARLIVVAPCCHKEVRPQLGHPAPLAAVLRHGVMEERMSEWATDGLRALFLEWAGYRTKVFEFVSTEHTPKNLMIAAILSDKPFVSHDARERIDQFKAFFGIKHHALDPLLQMKPGSK
jgi:methyltransferase family protein